MAIGIIALLLLGAILGVVARSHQSLKRMEGYLGGLWAQSEIDASRQHGELAEQERQKLRTKLGLPSDE